MYTTGLILERRCDAYRLSPSFMLPMALVRSGGATTESAGAGKKFKWFLSKIVLCSRFFRTRSSVSVIIGTGFYQQLHSWKLQLGSVLGGCI